MLPWLMRLGPRAAGLFRGTGWGKGAKGVEDVVRAARPQQTARYTPVKPLAKPIVNPYAPELVRRYGRTAGEKAFRGVPGVTTGGTRGAPTLTYRRTPAVTRDLPPGWARQHPKTTIATGLGTGIVGAGTAYGLMAGDEAPPIDPTRAMTAADPWSAPSDMMSFAESEIARVEQGEKDFRKLLDFGLLIAATGGKADKFFERGKWLLEQSEQFAQDKQYAKAVRAVYKEGDMPKSAREAYERLTPLMGPERAAVLSGHQLGMETGKTKEERAWNEIMAIAQMGDLDGAAAALVAAWNSGRLKNPATHITIYSAQVKKARETLEGVMSGGAGYAEGVTDIALREASA